MHGPRSVRAGSIPGLTVGAGRDGMPQARGSDDADPLELAGSRGPLARPQLRPGSTARAPTARAPSRPAAPSPVFTRAVHSVHCRAEAFPSGRRPLMNDIGANEALRPLRTRSARPCGSLTESGPNLEHWKTVATSCARASRAIDPISRGMLLIHLCARPWEARCSCGLKWSGGRGVAEIRAL